MNRSALFELYINKKQSVSQIARLNHCSENRINYWLAKYKIPKRSISEAIYQRRNPKGDPFALKHPKNLQEGILFGLGLGLYWGEGAKRGKGGVRLANTDPHLVKKFIEFLEAFLGVENKSLRFSLQIFPDISPEKAMNFWKRQLGVKKSQFYKTIILKPRGKGTYGYKSEHGVVILYFNNVKLKALICRMIENIHQV